MTRYTIDPREQLRAFRDMETGGEELVAIYHSHPITQPYPSPTDRAEAHYPEAFYVLVSLRDTKEGAGSLLDSTQVLLGSNLGDASGHGTNNLPILLAGGGYRHGQHIAGDTKNNTPLAKLFVNMLQRFGVETNEFGSGKGTIDGLV